MSSLPEPTVFISGRIQQGTTLNGVYEIESSLAPGGMGEVYKGHEVFSLKKVAIKFIRRELEENADARQMFINEGNSLAELHHDAIVRCFPLSIDPVLRRLYLPMEFVEGPSLFDLMEAGPIGADDVRLLLKRVGSGLQAAHERQIFHRDVSPDNIIIPSRDMTRAKLIDFGIARSTTSGRATVIGSGFAGKHNYVSPEQCGLFGGDVQAQSDIYSFGLVLAGALLGRPLDMGGSLIEVTAKRQKVPDLTGIEATLRPVIAAMLQPEPAARPPSMTAVAELLTTPIPAAPARATVVTPPKADGPVRPRKRLGMILVGGGVLTALGAAGVVFSYVSRPQSISANDDPMRAYLAAYDPDQCVFISPIAMAARTADVMGYSDDPQAFDALLPAFEGTFGFKPNIASVTVTKPQCQALSFARAAGAGQIDAPMLIVDQPTVGKKGGRRVAGSLAAPASASVALFRIDENGTVQDLTETLKKDEAAAGGLHGATWSFQPVLDRSGDAEPGLAPQVLLAVTSPKPMTLPSIVVTAPTASFLPQLKSALETGEPKPAIALAVFRLAK